MATEAQRAERLVKSKQRVADHGEVFTLERTYPPMTAQELADASDRKASE